jgi:hypothetical protein
MMNKRQVNCQLQNAKCKWQIGYLIFAICSWQCFVVPCLGTPVHAQQDPITKEEVLRQMKPASGIERERPTLWQAWSGWLIVGGVGILAGSLGAVLALRLARRNAPAGALSPHQAALKELARVEGLGLPQKGEYERYCTELSGIMRRYLEQRFRLAATRQTTPEFLDTMKTAGTLTSEQRALLRDFLEQCDLVKFAQATPPAESLANLSQALERFVRQTGG